MTKAGQWTKAFDTSLVFQLKKIELDLSDMLHKGYEAFLSNYSALAKGC